MRRTVALATALLVLSGACRSGKKEGRNSDGAVRPRTALTVAPRRGGILRVGLERPRSLDPAQARSPSEVLLTDQLFDSLTTYDPAKLDIRPSLAARWQASPDQLHWDFALRPDARFTNGRPVTPADVKYSLERVVKKGSGSPELVVAQLEPIHGFRAFNVDGTAPGLAGITTPVPGVVHVDLDTPLSSLPAVLGHPAYGIVPREGVQSTTTVFANFPTGSGPFAIRTRTDTSIDLVRAPGSKALLDGIDVTLEVDAGAAYDAFKAGKLDWSLVPPERGDEAAERYGRDGFAPYLAVLFYGFNLKNPKFSDVRFREAIVHAVDRQAIDRVVYGGTVGVVDGPVARGVPGFQANPCGRKCMHDPARARALLAQAFPNGGVPPVQIDFDDDKTQEAIARAMQDNLSRVGIKAVLRPHPFSEYTQVVDRGQEELFRLGWIGVYPGPDNFLSPLFLTSSDTNVTGFSNPVIDGVLQAARREPDPIRRISLYQDAERRIMDLVPIVPLAQFQTQAVESTRVRDLVLNALGTFDGSAVWLASSG